MHNIKFTVTETLKKFNKTITHGRAKNIKATKVPNFSYSKPSELVLKNSINFKVITIKNQNGSKFA